MYVCVCNAVTDKAIQGELSVGTCCGRCKSFACQLIDQCLEKHRNSYPPYYTEVCA